MFFGAKARHEKRKLEQQLHNTKRELESAKNGNRELSAILTQKEQDTLLLQEKLQQKERLLEEEREALKEKLFFNLEELDRESVELRLHKSRVENLDSEKPQIDPEELNKDIKYSIENIRSLGGKISDIDDIADIIKEVTDQTDLLAVNATIEAARAGEAGGGFSIVAGEVAKLAKKSQAATNEIRLTTKTLKEDIVQIEEDFDYFLKNLDKIRDSIKNEKKNLELETLLEKIELFTTKMVEIKNSIQF